LEIWDREALRELLGDVVYDMIFGFGSNQKFFDTRYWGGLYKLLNEVLLHRELSINYLFDPEPAQPYLVVNGQQAAAGFDENLGAAISKSLAGFDFEAADGRPTLLRSSVAASTSFTDDWRSGEKTTSERASAQYTGNRFDPFCKTPTKMDIELLLWVGRGDREANSEMAGIVFEQDGETSTTYGPPISSSITTTTTDGERADPVYTPNEASFGINIAENKHFAINFNEETGTNTVSLDALKDLRSTHSVTQRPSATGDSDGLFRSYSSSRSEQQSNENILSMAFCSLPQADFEFPAE
jgi:hypothetical protein